jgi:hypothetical protein
MTLIDFVFVPIEKATTPPAGLIEHLKDRWWLYIEGKGVAYYRDKRGNRFPQCSGDKRITESLRTRLFPEAEVRFFPSIFHQINPHDYA